MHILFLTTHYYPAQGGVSHVVKYLAEGLVKKYNYTVSVFEQKREDGLKELVHEGVNIYRFDVRYVKAFRTKGETSLYQEKIRSLCPDAVIVEAAPTVTTELFLPLMKELDCKKYFHSHDFELLWYSLFKKRETVHDTLAHPKNVLAWRWYFRKFFKKYAEDFDGLLYISPFCKDYELFEKYTDVKRFFLQNAVDDFFFEVLPNSDSKYRIEKYCILVNRKYLVDVSNYNSSKRQLSVMEEYYKSRHQEYALIFVGNNEGEYSAMLRQKKIELDGQYGQREVHILTGIAREDIPAVMGEGTLYLTASMHEAASVALLETMAVGTPFISTNVGNARILPGGVVVDNVVDMHIIIDELLDNPENVEDLKTKGMLYTRETCRISSAVDVLHKIIIEGDVK